MALYMLLGMHYHGNKKDGLKMRLGDLGSSVYLNIMVLFCFFYLRMVLLRLICSDALCCFLLILSPFLGCLFLD